MGTPAVSAVTKAPFLKGLISPPPLRVPSGKMQTACPSPSSLTQESSRVAMAPRGSSRLMETQWMWRIQLPTMGI